MNAEKAPKAVILIGRIIKVTVLTNIANTSQNNRKNTSLHKQNTVNILQQSKKQGKMVPYHKKISVFANILLPNTKEWIILETNNNKILLDSIFRVVICRSR